MEQWHRLPVTACSNTMSKQKKNWLPLGLIAVSMLLLLTSQVIWLQRTYRAEKSQFVKRSGELLDLAARELYDSLTITRLKEEVGMNDSCHIQLRIGSEPGKRTLNYSKTVISRSEEFPPLPGLPDFSKDSLQSVHFDSTHMMVITQFNSGNKPFQESSLIASTTQDTGLNHLLRVTNRAPAGMRILFSLADDSLSIDTVALRYTEYLQQENSYTTFELKASDDPAPTGGSWLSTSSVGVNMLGSQRFTAYFSDYRSFLLGRMWEEILFSVLLFGLIGLAFAFIYRSWYKQMRLSLLKNDLLSNITHELKTPISSVSVAIEALRDFGVLQDPQLTREYLDISRDELKRLSLLVDRVLRLTTFEQKDPDLHLEKLDMAEISQTILRTMQVQFDQYEGRHELELSGQDFSLQGDRTHLSSVLFNLLDNALKYRNGENPRIQLRLEEKAHALEVSVKDNGVGIPAAYQERVFEKFFRVPQGNVHNTKGYGLGLSYVAAVVAKHGGQIRLQSQSGVGSQFTLIFPKMQQV